MTNTQLQANLAALTPAQRRIVTEAALVIRVAHDAGDTRPSAEIAAYVLARLSSTQQRLPGVNTVRAA